MMRLPACLLVNMTTSVHYITLHDWQHMAVCHLTAALS